MSADKLVDSTQLDADLTSVADAIRAKSGGSSQLAFPSGFVSEIGNIPSGETVYYGRYGCPYPKNISDNTTVNATAELKGCAHLETIYRENATSAGQYAGGYDCKSLKSVHYPKVTSITAQYFIRQQFTGTPAADLTHSLESVTIGSVGHPVTSLAASNSRWFYGDCKNGCTVTIFVDAATLAEVPSNVSTYVNGTNHPSGYVINVVYKNSTTGEVITA